MRARLKSKEVPTPNRLLSVPAPPEEEAAYSRGG